MSPHDIRDYARNKPFAPFRLVVSDGSTYEVHHPELCVVTQTTVTVGLRPAAGNAAPVDHLIDAFHIVKLIPLAPPLGDERPADVPPLEA